MRSSGTAAKPRNADPKDVKHLSVMHLQKRGICTYVAMRGPLAGAVPREISEIMENDNVSIYGRETYDVSRPREPF